MVKSYWVHQDLIIFLIVLSLEMRLISINSFLQNGNNWVHFENNSIHLGIKDGPKIRISITSLQ